MFELVTFPLFLSRYRCVIVACCGNIHSTWTMHGASLSKIGARSADWCEVSCQLFQHWGWLPANLKVGLFYDNPKGWKYMKYDPHFDKSPFFIPASRLVYDNRSRTVRFRSCSTVVFWDAGILWKILEMLHPSQQPFADSRYWLVVWNAVSHTLGKITPTDFHIFQRGWTHQPGYS